MGYFAYIRSFSGKPTFTDDENMKAAFIEKVREQLDAHPEMFVQPEAPVFSTAINPAPQTPTDWQAYEDAYGDIQIPDTREDRSFEERNAWGANRYDHFKRARRDSKRTRDAKIDSRAKKAINYPSPSSAASLIYK